MRLRLALLAATVVCAPTTAAARTTSVIVKYRPGVGIERRKQDSRRAGILGTVGTVRGQGARVVRVRGDAAAAARRLDELPDVVYAEPNARLYASAAPNDALFGQLGDLRLIDAVDGWDALGLRSYPRDGGVPVGIVDTGIDSAHEDLRSKTVACGHAAHGAVVTGGCADDNDHGTHVAGTIGAIADNSVGIAGVSFDSPLIVCKALGGDAGSGSIADVAGCVSWLHDRGAKVISMSLGGGSSTTLRRAVRAAWESGGAGGSVLVAAAGNDGTTQTEYPAGYDEVVSVAAVDDSGRHASFSNFNDDVEIAAPGVDVLSTKRGGGYVRFSGTSMATPHVAGAAALIWDGDRGARAAAIRERLDGAVIDKGPAGDDPRFGLGVLNLLEIARPQGD